MSKMSKAVAVLGVVAGLGVAALPLSTYAATTATRTAQVQVEVAGGISLAFDQPDNQIDGATFTEATRLLDLGQVTLGGAIKEGAFKVVVETNNPIGYELKIAAKDSTDMTSENGDTIATGIPTPNATTSAWGYKVGAGTYTPLTTGGATISAADDATEAPTGGGTGRPSKGTDVTFGVAAQSSQAEGTYVGNVVFTASVK